MGKYFVYILQSDVTANFYVGQTNNVEDRLWRHNNGKVKSTKHGLPWNLIRSYICETRSEAMLLEKKIKGRGVERYLSDSNIGV